MTTDQQFKKLLGVLERIAESLETLAAAVDEDEDEINVYVRGEVSTDAEE